LFSKHNIAIITSLYRYENLEGRRGRGRPRLRWLTDVEDDLRMLGVKRWRRKALEREEWALVIKEAKVKLKGP
jgi:hypothetical protein